MEVSLGVCKLRSRSSESLLSPSGKIIIPADWKEQLNKLNSYEIYSTTCKRTSREEYGLRCGYVELLLEIHS